MKKILTLLLALVMIAALTTACASKTAAPSASAASSSGTGSKVLRVGMECAYAPYNWTQPDNSNGAVPIYQSSDYTNGYDVMIAKKLADKLGYKLEIHKIDWDSLPMAVQSGTVDCVIDGMSITAKREETIDFTTPYYYANIVVLTLASSKYASATGLAGLAGASATSQINTVWYDKFVPQISNVKQLPAMESTSAMLVALESKKCDLVVTDKPTAMGAQAVYKDMKMLDFTSGSDNFKFSDEDVNLGIACKKGNTDLVNALNGALKDLTKADFEKIMTEAIKDQPLSN